MFAEQSVMYLFNLFIIRIIRIIRISFVGLVGLGGMGFVGLVFADAKEQGHWGYISDVVTERNQRVFEMVMIDEVPPQEKVNINNFLFVPKLKKEFLERYEKEFGHTIPEQSILINQRYNTEVDSFSHLTTEEVSQKEKLYGEYVARRLIEYHADQYFQQSPNLRPVYEVKERLSNVKLEVRRGYNVKIHYSLSGNNLDLDLENPWSLESKLVIQMNENAFGPTKAKEVQIKLGVPLESTLKVTSFYGLQKKQFTLAVIKELSEKLIASLTGSTYWEDPEQERKIVVGLAWNY